jgi:UDP-glucose 4-epimerase
MKNRILITGSNGYIASYLIEHLNKSNYDIIVTSRNKDLVLDKKETRYMDLLNEDSISGICKDVDYVIHCATYNEKNSSIFPKENLIANGYATRLLLEDAKKNNVSKFIYLSTFHVYGKNEGIIDEGTVSNPVSDYSISHLLAENFCLMYKKKYNLNTIILRISNGIGLPNKLNRDKWTLVLNDMCLQAYKSNEIKLNSSGKQQRDFISIKDICFSIETILEKQIKEDIFNVSSQNSISIIELAKKVKNVFELKFKSKIRIMSKLDDIQKIGKLTVLSKRLQSYGWKPKDSIEKVISEIFDFLIKENNYDF